MPEWWKEQQEYRAKFSAADDFKFTLGFVALPIFVLAAVVALVWGVVLFLL